MDGIPYDNVSLPYTLKERDPPTWQYFGNFSMYKNNCAFSAIEQENCSLKKLSDIKGTFLNKAAFHRFSLASPELSKTCDKFLESNSVMSYLRKLHYQLTGSVNLRIITSVKN